jgi:hypothetical protein
MNLQLILGVVFGGGFATLVATVARVFDSRRKGKLESEDSVLTRLETENRKARQRADEAEGESEGYRKRMMMAEDQAALFRRMLIQNGITVPREGTGHANAS